MDSNRDNIVLVFLFGVLLVTLIGLFASIKVAKTGHAGDMRTTPSQVKIKAFVAIAMSDNLSQGIDFGEVETLPVFLNGTANYNGTDQSGYYISVSKDSNKRADFCLNASRLDTDTGEEIGLGNYTWSNSSVTDITSPSLNNRVAFTETPVKGAFDVDKGTDQYFRFWLNITDAQPGLYNNSVSFIAVPTGTSCI